MGLRKTGVSRAWNAINGIFDTTLNAKALALRKERMRSHNIVAGEDGIKKLTASLAGGLQMGVESESNQGGIVAAPSAWVIERPGRAEGFGWTD